jgi:hypothetical protein
VDEQYIPIENRSPIPVYLNKINIICNYENALEDATVDGAFNADNQPVPIASFPGEDTDPTIGININATINANVDLQKNFERYLDDTPNIYKSGIIGKGIRFQREGYPREGDIRIPV